MVADYYAQLRQPIPIRALSARFRERCYRDGYTFRDWVIELESLQLIRVRFKPNGSRVVYPGLTAWK